MLPRFLYDQNLLISIIGELGDGNFTRVYKASLKSTRQIFAIKTIEKTVVEQMKRRHPNINNEILMEKKVNIELESYSLF